MVCCCTAGTAAVTSESTAPEVAVGVTVAGTATEPACEGTATGFEAAVEGLLDETRELSVCAAEGVVFRGVGNRIGVTATTSAVSNSAIESLLSIYGTGSKPPGRKG